VYISNVSSVEATLQACDRAGVRPSFDSFEPNKHMPRLKALVYSVDDCKGLSLYWLMWVDLRDRGVLIFEGFKSSKVFWKSVMYSHKHRARFE
jgi:hypothetical protein